MLIWRSLSQALIPGPRAWFTACLELDPLAWKASPGTWQDLSVMLNHQRLKLHLNQSQQLWVEWPALEPGFYSLKLYGQGACLQSWPIFVSAPPLNQAQWLHLLQDLRYGLPWRLLAAQQRWQSVHVSRSRFAQQLPHRLPHSIEEEALFWQAELSLKGGFRQALQSIDLQPLSQLSQQAAPMPLARIRRPTARLLYQDLRSLPAQRPLWHQQTQIHLERPENQLVSLLVHSLLRRFQTLAKSLPTVDNSRPQSAKSNPTAALFQMLHTDLNRLWHRHCLAQIKPAQAAVLAPTLQSPAYVYCEQLLRHAQLLAWPDFEGSQRLAYRQFGLLYQDWCQLHLLSQVLDWGQQQGWQLVRMQRFPQRGKVLTLTKAAQELSLWVERSFSSSSAEIISISRRQRPDFCLFLRTRQADKSTVRGIVFDAKFRQQHNQAHKSDLDRLHAYRDAIRWQGQPVFGAGILLYPGQASDYAGQISAWQSLPTGQSPDWPLAQTLQRLLLV